MGVACCFRREGASLSNTRVNITGILFSGISLSQEQNYGVIPLTNDIKSSHVQAIQEWNGGCQRQGGLCHEICSSAGIILS